MWRHVDVNTLLKVLEQLLHKIKANRRREMFLELHALGASAADKWGYNLYLRQIVNANTWIWVRKEGPDVLLVWDTPKTASDLQSASTNWRIQN